MNGLPAPGFRQRGRGNPPEGICAHREGHVLHGHGGDADGYLSRFGYNRDSGQAYFIMINAFQHKALNEIRALIESIIVADLPKSNLPIKDNVTQEALLNFVGNYSQVTKRFGSLANSKRLVRVFMENNKLYTQEAGGSARELIPVTEQHFRRRNQSVATIAFVEYNHRHYLQGDIGNFVKQKTSTETLAH